jgi:hypothetical protein
MRWVPDSQKSMRAHRAASRNHVRLLLGQTKRLQHGRKHAVIQHTYSMHETRADRTGFDQRCSNSFSCFSFFQGRSRLACKCFLHMQYEICKEILLVERLNAVCPHINPAHYAKNMFLLPFSGRCHGAQMQALVIIGMFGTNRSKSFGKRCIIVSCAPHLQCWVDRSYVQCCTACGQGQFEVENGLEQRMMGK